MNITVAAIAAAAVLLLGFTASAQAGTGALRADTGAACANAKAKVKKAKRAVKEAKPVGGEKLQRAKRKLQRAKQAKRRACAGSDEGGTAWSEGRYQGTYAENNADLAFNVVGARLFTGPFDGFYLDATCRNVDPEYTGDQIYTNAHAYEPVEATIGAGGSFFGQGTYNTGYTSHDWTIRGQITGKRITGGEFSATYTDTYGNPCRGTTRFTADWYGDYTL